MKKQIVTVGGGTGTFTVLQGLKRYCDRVDLAAVVTMADSGGSTGRLRDEFGQLPVGDVRMALVALAREDAAHEQLLRQLFLYRFEKGEGLSGHNFGNLLLVALTDIMGSEAAAIAAAGRVLGVRGRVYPVTEKPVDLVATYDTGATVVGEHGIDEPEPDNYKARIAELSTRSVVTIAEGAARAISEADYIVMGPGDLYTSVLANVVVPGVADVLQQTNARLVYVANLMTKRGQTHNFTLHDHVTEIERYTGRPIDVVLYNNSSLPVELLVQYEIEGEYPVAIKEQLPTHFHGCDLLTDEVVHVADGDVLRRSLIRHDSRKLAKAIMELMI